VERSEIAKDVGVSETTIWRWEHHQRVPREQAAIRYMRVLDAIKLDAIKQSESSRTSTAA
jgi:DNA-binding XRE family transcriptional regulator